MKHHASVFDHFEKLVSRVPAAIRGPLEKEWRPLRDLFLKRRAARLIVIGEEAEAFTRSTILAPARKESPPPVFSGSPWSTCTHQGTLDFVFASGRKENAKAALAASPPDLYLFLCRGGGSQPDDLALLLELHRLDRDRYGSAAPIIALAPEEETANLSETLHGQSSLQSHIAAILPITHREAFLTAMARALPDDTRMEFARLTGEKAVQREIASALTRSAAAVCTAIGAQPIPFADFPILTALQAAMVAGIIQVSGRPWSLATARDFLGALGVNVGAGLALREGTRAVVKLLPGWGNAISGGVAGAATYALGRAASAYFIEGVPIEEARRRLKLKGNKKNPQLPPAKEE